MTMYERVKPATVGPVADTYLELKMLCLFYFAFESEKNGHNVGTAVVPEKRFYLSPCFFLFQLFLDQFIRQFINVIATDLLMDELNVSYFAQKLWLYLMIWLPRTTDNSTHFAQSLEIRGNESRLYINLIFCQLHSNMIIGHLIKIDHIQNGHEKQNGHQLKQKGLNSNLTSKLFNFLMVYMKECLEEVNCEKNQLLQAFS